MATALERHRCIHVIVRAGIAGVCFVAALVTSSCLDRPLTQIHPATTNVVVTEIQRESVTAVDLLFMIDNSQSMADKQSLLATAVPALMRRLLEPRCVDPATKQPTGGNFPCAQGEPEFKPLSDIHVGVITSSIGGHGAEICSPAWGELYNPTQDDAAHLLGERRSLPGHEAAGFLAWNPTDAGGDANAFISSFGSDVTAAGEQGCGYEAQLESWYRFLVDPEPPASIMVTNGVANVTGVDDVVLQQRADFLRPDSLVAVVMLTDENDCSIVDGGTSWYVAQQKDGMFKATSACANDPNDPCCRSCSLNDAPPGCTAVADDPACAGNVYDPADDNPNLRCFDQKRRFGVDFLYPVARYVDGLTQSKIRNRAGDEVDNPLLLDPATGTRRDPSLVYLAGIVGVPWQDIASQDSLSDPSKLSYLTASELTARGRWDWLVSNGTAPPADALMIESETPRSGQNPATSSPLVAPDATGRNPVNGHEWNPGGADLEFACIYPLAAPRDCATIPSDKGCDCRNVVANDPAKNPLCQDPATGSYGTTQHFAKAYPATRQLSVLKAVGENSIVASICPKITDGDSAAPAFGYNPAVDAIVDRLKEKFNGRCLPRPLQIRPDGSANCAIVEATTSSTCACDASQNRGAASDTLAAAVRKELRASGRCGTNAPAGPCEELCLCQIGNATDMNSCENDPTANGIGWCYVDPDRGIGNPALVADCAATDRRLVRFVGDNTPEPGSSVFIACEGAPIGSGAP